MGWFAKMGTRASSFLENKRILITGGTGSFGKAFIRMLLRETTNSTFVVFSRDELKQHEMQTRQGFDSDRLRFFIGDVRDAKRVKRAVAGVDVIVHAAALKQVPACEYNPLEAVRTNISGAENVINAALDEGVRRVIALSTDKAVNPVNLYGATKLVMEKLFVQANAYSGKGVTRFSCVRYGNVVGSRGSVVPLFFEQRKAGRVTVTDKRMTRFWITLQEGVQFVKISLARMYGGEVFVPKIPSTGIMEIVKALAPGCKVEYVGIRPGEKLHEILISENEARHTLDVGTGFLIQPSHPWWPKGKVQGKALRDGFRYSSDRNHDWLTVKRVKELVARHFEPH